MQAILSSVYGRVIRNVSAEWTIYGHYMLTISQRQLCSLYARYARPNDILTTILSLEWLLEHIASPPFSADLADQPSLHHLAQPGRSSRTGWRYPLGPDGLCFPLFCRNGTLWKLYASVSQ